MSLHAEAFSRYHETHEGHLGYTGREEWAREVYRLNFLPHMPAFVGHRVLEIACGQGDMVRVFREKGFSVVGTDLDSSNVRKTEHVVLHNVFERPIQSTQFDIIVMMGIIEHIPKDELLPAMRNVRSMLAPGGALFITTQNMDSMMGDHFRYLDITHELGFTRESLSQVGRLAGFKPEVYRFINPPPQTSWKAWVVRRIVPLYRRLYGLHLKLVEPAMGKTWWDADGLLGVWRGGSR
jgi:SAM-dependent methyltransferase